VTPGRRSEIAAQHGTLTESERYPVGSRRLGNTSSGSSPLGSAKEARIGALLRLESGEDVTVVGVRVPQLPPMDDWQNWSLRGPAKAVGVTPLGVRVPRHPPCRRSSVGRAPC
jgi:hypothetical protein